MCVYRCPLSFKKRLHHRVGKAISDWRMISENDRVLIGMSGGSDSQVLLDILHDFKKKSPVRFTLLPVHIDPGFPDSSAEALKEHIQLKYDRLLVEYQQYGQIAHSAENRENPCFLCARLRRKRLFELAKENNCRKIALGHHKDDLIETLFINICYAGKIGTMKPRQSFFKGALEIIRPLAYVEKQEIKRFCSVKNLPEFKNNCPSADKTKREEIRELLKTLYAQNPHIKGNIFRSMSNVAHDYLLTARPTE